jgi:hypothetical protein
MEAIIIYLKRFFFNSQGLNILIELFGGRIAIISELKRKYDRICSMSISWWDAKVKIYL